MPRKTVALREVPSGSGRSEPEPGLAPTGDALGRRSVLEAVERSKGKLGIKAHAVLFLRLVSTDEAGTLRAIERKYGYAPHRVKQVEEAALSVVDAETGCLAAVRASLLDLWGSLPQPVSFIESEGWGVGLGPAALRRIGRDYGGLHVVAVPGIGDILVPFGPDVWAAATVSLDRHVVGSVDPVDPARFDQATESLGLSPTARAACIRALRLVQRQDPTPDRLSPSRMAMAIDAILPPGGPAVPFRDIADRLRRLVPGPLDEGKLRIVLAGIAIEPVAGAYASPKGADMPAATARAIALRCGTIIGNHRLRASLTTSDLLLRLRSVAPGTPRDLDEVQLERILIEQGLQTHRDRGGWSLPSMHGRTVPAHRDVETMLARHGAPMPTADIEECFRKEHNRTLGGGLWVTGRLVEVDEGVIGLVDRDLPIDASQCRDVIAVARQLTARGGTSSVAALTRILERKPYGDRLPNGHALRSLLKVHGGLVVGVGGRLRDRIRYEPREGTSATRMVVDILTAHPDGVDRGDLLDAMRRALGKEPGPDIVRHTLWKYGVRDAVNPDLWRLRPPDAEPKGIRSALDVGAGDSGRRHAYPTQRKLAESKGPPFGWTPERVAILRRLVAEGAGSRRIIDALGGGVSKSAVVAKAHRLGLTVGG